MLKSENKIFARKITKRIKNPHRYVSNYEKNGDKRNAFM